MSICCFLLQKKEHVLFLYYIHVISNRIPFVNVHRFIYKTYVPIKMLYMCKKEFFFHHFQLYLFILFLSSFVVVVIVDKASSSTSKKNHLLCFRYVHSCGTKLTSETRATAKVSAVFIACVYNVIFECSIVERCI